MPEASGRCVRASTLVRLQVFVESVPDDRMDEAKRLIGCRDDLRSHQDGTSLGELLGVELGQLAGVPRLSPVAQHCHGVRQFPRLPWEPRQPRQHHPRYAPGLEFEHAGGIRRNGPDPLRRDLAQQLAEEEGVAGRGAMTGSAELVVGARGDSAKHELRGGGHAELSRTDTGRRGIHEQLCGHWIRPRVDRPRSRHQCDSESVEPASEEPQERQRHLVGPLNVVNGQ
jgi:hypothetical protein